MTSLQLLTTGFTSDKLKSKLSGKLALTNQIFLSPGNFEKFQKDAIEKGTIPSEANYANTYGVPLDLYDREKFSTYTFNATSHPAVPDDRIVLNKFAMPFCQYRLDKSIEVKLFEQQENGSFLSEVTIEVTPFRATEKGKTTDDIQKTHDVLLQSFDKHVLHNGHVLIVSGPDSKQPLHCTVKSLRIASLDGSDDSGSGDNFDFGSNVRGVLNKKTVITLVAKKGEMTLSGASEAKQTEALNIDFLEMGIGGLGKEFKEIFRRAFASRVYPKDVIEKLGIRHVKGILLYGPPGCGKTLIARKIGEALKARPPKIINGPEILNKYVGGSEEKIREQFADAEEEYRKLGEDSELHIIIFDEIDAICKQRGSSRDSTGVGDNVVNQLLAKLDGVEQVNNILVIGMTNRKDMIDDALMRPGRLEVKVEIGLPDEFGRTQILQIHTSKMRNSGFLGSDVSIPNLATMTKNYTGAEIEGLCKAASSFALNRQIDDIKAKGDMKFDVDKISVDMQDFTKGMADVPANFGVKEENLQKYFYNGICNFGPIFNNVKGSLEAMVDQVRGSDRTPLLSVLLHGKPSSGKSALAAYIAVNSKFPYVKMLSADQLIGYAEAQKVEKIRKIFDDASKTPLSLIVLDDIENLLSYVRLGGRFSNDVLQALLVLCKKVPEEKGRKVIVIGITSQLRDMDSLGLKDIFNVTLEMPNVQPSEIPTVMKHWTPDVQQTNVNQIAKSMGESDIPIKKLLMVLEMALQSDGGVNEDSFQSALIRMGYTSMGF